MAARIPEFLVTRRDHGNPYLPRKCNNVTVASPHALLSEGAKDGLLETRKLAGWASGLGRRRNVSVSGVGGLELVNDFICRRENDRNIYI